MAIRLSVGHSRAMKRLLAAPLWFMTGWFIGAVAAFLIGLDGALAPILAFVAASAVALDPRQMIWMPRVAAHAEMAHKLA